jgi:hypothetical protein
MHWYKKSQTETVSLTDFYDESELNDTSEALHEFVSEDDFNTKFTVRLANSDQLKTLKTHMGEDTVLDVFNDFATEEQKQIVQNKIDRWDSTRIVVIANQTLLDGYHQVIAAILSNRPQKYIDIYEEI